MYQHQRRYISSTYAGLDRSQEESFGEHQTHQVSPELAAAAIADAIATEGPLRVPIGQDAV
jgi:hypothetical protein